MLGLKVVVVIICLVLGGGYLLEVFLVGVFDVLVVGGGFGVVEGFGC